MAHPLKKSQRKREEPKLGEPKLVEHDSDSELVVAQELQGESVADTLIRARQQIGQDLRSIAEVLCIRYSYLDAIERGQYENLPGATYAVGFVRSYAEYLGLDGEQVVERFKTEVEGLDSQTKLHFPTPAPEGKMPGGAVFLVAALIFAGAYGVWFYLSNQGESLTDLVAPVPERLQELVAGGSTAGSGDVTPATPASPAPAEPAAAAAPPAPVATETAPSATPAPAPQATADAPAASQLSASPTVEATPLPPAAAEPIQSVPEQATAIPESVAPAAPPAVVPPAPEAAAAPREAAPAVAPQTGTSLAVTPTQPAEAAPVRPLAENAPQQETAVTPEAPAATVPGRGEPLAIPAAPDSNTPATAFLVNHEPKVYGEENADARIVLKANQDAWVQVRDRQGTLLLTRVLRAGDSYRVPNQGDLTLLTGNAGGLEIVIDGRPLAPLGPVGAVRRNIPLDPQALAGGTAQ